MGVVRPVVEAAEKEKEKSDSSSVDGRTVSAPLSEGGSLVAWRVILRFFREDVVTTESRLRSSGFAGWEIILDSRLCLGAIKPKTRR